MIRGYQTGPVVNHERFAATQQPLIIKHPTLQHREGNKTVASSR